MGITCRGTTGFGGAVTSVNTPQSWLPNFQPGRQPTDVLLMCLEYICGSEVVLVPPPGWTLMLRIDDGTGALAWGMAYYIGLGTVDQSAPGYITFPNPPSIMDIRFGGMILDYIGVDPVSPLDVNAAAQLNTAVTTLVTAPSISTLTSGALLLGTFGTWGYTDVNYDHASEFNGPLWAPQRTINSLANYADPVSKFSYQDKIQVSPGASGLAVSDAQISNPEWHSIGIMIALRAIGTTTKILDGNLSFSGNLDPVWTNAHPEHAIIVQRRSKT